MFKSSRQLKLTERLKHLIQFAASLHSAHECIHCKSFELANINPINSNSVFGIHQLVYRANNHCRFLFIIYMSFFRIQSRQNSVHQDLKSAQTNIKDSVSHVFPLSVYILSGPWNKGLKCNQLPNVYRDPYPLVLFVVKRLPIHSCSAARARSKTTKTQTR